MKNKNKPNQPNNFANIPIEDIVATHQAPKYPSDGRKCWGGEKLASEVWGEDDEAPNAKQFVPSALRSLGFRLARPEAGGLYMFFCGPDTIDVRNVNRNMRLVEVRPGYKYDNGKDARRLVPATDVLTGERMLVSPIKLFYTREI